MKRRSGFQLSVVACAALLLGAQSPSVLAVNDEPIKDKWAPSEWGAKDMAGSANRRSPQSVLAATKLVKKGKVATLGKVYQQDAPG